MVTQKEEQHDQEPSLSPGTQLHPSAEARASAAPCGWGQQVAILQRALAPQENVPTPLLSFSSHFSHLLSIFSYSVF